MNLRKITWLGVLASLALTPTAFGQTPPVPPAGSAAALGPVTAPAAPAAAPANLWSFLCPTDAQKAACKTCFCNSAIGQMVSSAAAPMSAMSGGLMPNRCLQNSIANDIANKPSDSSEGAAARIKKDEEDAKARRNAVRFLGTVDCSRWPEAEAALAISLRFDRNECVRLEAALALRSGCCCTNTIIDALTNCVLGENKMDKFPIEKSGRVRAAAAEALARCPLIERPVEIDIKDKDKIEKKVDARPILDPKQYYERVAQLPREQVVANARAVLVSMQQGGKAQPVGPGPKAATISAAPVPALPQRSAGLAGLFTNAFAAEGTTAGASVNGAAPSRQPFFSGLTKSLTGKQENVVIARQETAAAVSSVKVPVYDVKPVMPPDPVPPPASNVTKPTMPAPLRIETRPAAATETTPATTIEIKQAAPVEARPVSTIEIRQGTEAKPALPRGEVTTSQPRETTGVAGTIEVEEQSVLPSTALPPISLPAGSRR